MSERPRITLTGADEAVPLPHLEELARRPGVEIGILCSVGRRGTPRYPQPWWIEKVVALFTNRVAVHLCGREARDEFFNRRLAWISRAGRVQINGRISPEAAGDALSIVETIITQTREDEPDRWFHSANHHLLVDASGGRGILPERWRRPLTLKPVGFAGGLGPENLAAELPRIAGAAGPRWDWWVDMESSLRDRGDHFSIERANRCVDIFEEYLSLWCRGRAESPP